jgi:ribosomal protein S18 acetylase RimI-like enzyme
LITRPATDHDIAFLEDVFLQAMRISIEACRGYWDEAKEQAQFREQLQLTSTQIIENDGKDVGFLMTLGAGRDIRLHTLCIVPEYQGQGLGTGIIRALLDSARTRGCGVVLAVLKTNRAARSLYERLGFVVTEETTNHFHMRFAS